MVKGEWEVRIAEDGRVTVRSEVTASSVLKSFLQHGGRGPGFHKLTEGVDNETRDCPIPCALPQGRWEAGLKDGKMHFPRVKSYCLHHQSPELSILFPMQKGRIETGHERGDALSNRNAGT